MAVARQGDVRVVGTANVVELAGSPHEQGCRHGRCAREAIRANVIEVRRWFAHAEPSGRRYDHDAILARHERFIERVAPGVLDEIRGIAEGAGLPYLDVLTLNAPLYFIARHLPVDCTQIYLGPPATDHGTTYLAKTRDLAGTLAHVVLHRRYDDGCELAEVNAAGSVTWPGSGVNSHGVAYGTSGCWSKRTVVDIDRAASGWLLFNGHLVLRDSRSLDEFAERLVSQPRITPINVVAGDARAGAVFEATAERVYRTGATDGVGVLTNHYLTPEIRSLGPTLEEHPSSHSRHATATARIRAEYGTWTADGLRRLLGDHEGFPQRSICRHSRDGEGADTVYASIASLPDRTLWVTPDHPCRA